MKKLFKINLALPTVFILFLFISLTKLQAQGGPVSVISYQNFYDDLSPYGSWIDYPAYGQVWHPNVNGNFRPYLTNGAWDYSTSGWMWISNYNWGWAPFHYGRWVYDDMYGWLWIPGYEWSPAWVTWGMFGDNYAWAPLMPGINVSIAFGSYRPPSFYWNAVGRKHIYDRDIYKRSLPRNQIHNSVTNITVINNYGNTEGHKQYYSRGPQLNEVEKYTQRTITPAAIGERNIAGPTRREGNQLQVYKPSVTTPQPREFRKMDKDHVQPLIENVDQSDIENQASERALAAPAPGKENSSNKNTTSVKSQPTLLRGNENTLKENGKSIKRQNDPAAQGGMYKAVTPGARNNEISSGQMSPGEQQIRNNEMEQRQNIERLPVVHSPQPSRMRPSGRSHRN